MTASFSLGPPDESPGKLFLKSQFCSSVRWPPKDTSLAGKVAIVTGSSGGLGLEAARQFLSFGLSSLIIAVRSPKKGEDVASKLQDEYPNAKFQVWSLEMESYDSIQTFARRANAELPRLDIAILNAGVQLPKFTIVASTGHEKSIQVNHLSTMLLAILLLPVLKDKSPAGEPGRLTIINSGTARGATLSEPIGTPILPALDDAKRPWKPVERYAVSKLLAHLSIMDLVKYVKAEDVVVNLVNPGLVKNTDLQRFVPLLLVPIALCYKAILGRSLPVGASTYVDAAVVKGRETHGCYVEDWQIARYAAFVYGKEGVAAREQLWKETMTEFEFADVKKILDDMRDGDR